MKKIFATAFAILFLVLALSCQEGKSIYDYGFGTDLRTDKRVPYTK